MELKQSECYLALGSEISGDRVRTNDRRRVYESLRWLGVGAVVGVDTRPTSGNKSEVVAVSIFLAEEPTVAWRRFLSWAAGRRESRSVRVALRDHKVTQSWWAVTYATGTLFAPDSDRRLARPTVELLVRTPMIVSGSLHPDAIPLNRTLHY